MHVALPEAAFEALKAYALREDAEPVLRYAVQRGRPGLRVGPYVGLLRASDSVSIELLPKITTDFTPATLSTSRAALLRMLLGASQLFPRLLPEARLSRLADFPLPDVLAALFLQRADKLLHRGLVTAYQSVETEQAFVKGKLLNATRPFGATHQARPPARGLRCAYPRQCAQSFAESLLAEIERWPSRAFGAAVLVHAR